MKENTPKKILIVSLTFIALAILIFLSLNFVGALNTKESAVKITYSPEFNKINNVELQTRSLRDTIKLIAMNVSLSHEYIKYKYDCTQFSKELVKQLRAINLTAYCVGTFMWNWKDENKTKVQGKYLHTWVEVKNGNETIPVESLSGEIIPDDLYKKDYVVTERGVCW